MYADRPVAPAPPARERGGREPQNRLSVARKDRGRRSRITLAGEIDLGTAPLVYAALAGCPADEERVIEVDLSAVGFCDCAGLSVFLQVRERATAAGGHIRLRRPQPAVARLFAVSGTDSILLGRRLPVAARAPAPYVDRAPR